METSQVKKPSIIIIIFLFILLVLIHIFILTIIFLLFFTNGLGQNYQETTANIAALISYPLMIYGDISIICILLKKTNIVVKIGLVAAIISIVLPIMLGLAVQ